MKLKDRICPTLLLYPFVDGFLACQGTPQWFPYDGVFKVVKRKKNITLIRRPGGGFKWVNNSELEA